MKNIKNENDANLFCDLVSKNVLNLSDVTF